MKTILAGSRTIWSYAELELAIANSRFDITEVVCGMAPGADSVGWAWAHTNGIKIIEMPADWNDVSKGIRRKNKWGKPYNPLAGHERNARMATVAEALIALHDGVSTGTNHMIRTAKDFGLKVHVHVVKPCQKTRATIGGAA